MIDICLENLGLWVGVIYFILKMFYGNIVVVIVVFEFDKSIFGEVFSF